MQLLIAVIISIVSLLANVASSLTITAGPSYQFDTPLFPRGLVRRDCGPGSVSHLSKDLATDIHRFQTLTVRL